MGLRHLGPLAQQPRLVLLQLERLGQAGVAVARGLQSRVLRRQRGEGRAVLVQLGACGRQLRQGGEQLRALVAGAAGEDASPPWFSTMT